jgi:hypothetical protein
LLDKPTNVHNADKSGFPLNNKHSAEKEATNIMRQRCIERGENITIVACTNAIRSFIPPVFIFKGKRFFTATL